MVLISIKQKEGYASTSNSRTCVVLETELTEELILGTKTALMGPFAGIGDSLWGATYNSIIASIAIGLSEGGSLLGVVFFLIFHAGLSGCGKRPYPGRVGICCGRREVL